MIKKLKAMAAGTPVKAFPLLIKTARKVFADASGDKWQEVVFMDSSGEITGHISMEGNVPWQSKTNLCIMEATIQDTDERGRQGVKLVVTDCFDAATPFTYDQGQEMSAEDYRKGREDEIKGKIRHGIVCAMIRRVDPSGKIHLVPDKKGKDEINELVEFIQTGE